MTRSQRPTGDIPPPTGDIPPPTGDIPPPAGDIPPPAGDTPWATGLTVSGFVAVVSAAAVVVLSLGVARVHPLLAVGLNGVAFGGLAPTLWGWRHVPVLRWFVLGAAVGVLCAWVALGVIAVARMH